MYVPAHFAASDADVAALLDGAHVVDLVTPTTAGLVATPLPMLLDGSGLLGHVARNNPHWQAEPASESMVIAHGPEAYVSPSWYASKREHGRVVPTWNYLIAHVYGELVVHDDVEWLRGLVTRLTERHEAGLAHPWAVTDAPAKFIDGQLRAIVGVELRITRIEAKAKLSQNRPPADRDGVIAGLDGHPIAGLIRDHDQDVQPGPM
jgi:transcriptional regulator